MGTEKKQWILNNLISVLVIFIIIAKYLRQLTYKGEDLFSYSLGGPSLWLEGLAAFRSLTKVKDDNVEQEVRQEMKQDTYWPESRKPNNYIERMD